jgi:hypothetical protein
MIDKLKEALITKEKTDYYLKNLEELKANNTVEENHYIALKDEYTKLREDSQAKIFSLKAQYKKMLDTEIKKLTTAQLDLKYLEIRHKVGQMSQEEYASKIREPKRKCQEQERKITELKKIVAVNYSHELTEQKKFSLFGKKKSSSLLADIPKTVRITPVEVKEEKETSEETKPENAEQVSPSPVPPVPPEPPESPEQSLPPVIHLNPPATQPIITMQEPLPPPIVITTISEEKPPEPEPEPEPPPPAITVLNLEILPDRVEQGNQIGVIANITNGNEFPLRQTVELIIDEKIADSCEVDLDSKEDQELTFIITAQDIGEHKVIIENTAKSFIVMEKTQRPR